MKEIIFYTDTNGKSPFEEWYNCLDNSIRLRIDKRLQRITLGNYGDYKVIDSELKEFRFAIGKGYRIYFTEKNNLIIIITNAGDKQTQIQDIKKAKEIIHDIKERY